MRNVAQYVGVAATTSRREVEALVGMLDQVGWPHDVRFMNGPLVSRKTLRGLPASDPSQYPPIEEIAGLLIDDPRVMNVIHFNSRDPRLLDQLTEMAEMMALQGGRLDGFQLNILWPQRDDLEELSFRYPQLKIILQISRYSLDSVGGDIDALIECMRSYAGLVHYLLFDPSGGEGLPFDQQQAAALIKALMKSELPMALGVTGGLAAEMVGRLEPLTGMYPGLCWDAQSRLRDKEGRLDLAKCRDFLAASANLLK